MKKLSVLVIIMILAVNFFSTGTFAEDLKFAAILKTLANPHWVSMKNGYEEEAARHRRYSPSRG